MKPIVGTKEKVLILYGVYDIYVTSYALFSVVDGKASMIKLIDVGRITWPGTLHQDISAQASGAKLFMVPVHRRPAG